MLKKLYYAFVMSCLFFSRHFLVTGEPRNSFYYFQTAGDLVLMISCFALTVLLLVILMMMIERLNKAVYGRAITALLFVSALPLVDYILINMFFMNIQFTDGAPLPWDFLTLYPAFLIAYIPTAILTAFAFDLGKYSKELFLFSSCLCLLVVYYAVPRYLWTDHIDGAFKITNNRTPVHMIIFDGMSADVLGSKANKGKFPNICEFSSGSYSFPDAHSPGYPTINSLPRIWISQYSKIIEEKYSGLLISTCDPTALIPLPVNNSIFRSAKEDGYNTVLLGESLPYCDIFSSDITFGRCFSACGRFEQLLPTPVADILRIKDINRRWNLSRLFGEYFDFIDKAPDNTFFYLHTLVTHEPAIFHGNGAPYSYLDGIFYNMAHSFDERYTEQMIFADRKFGEIVSILRKNGVYDRSLVILMADHNCKLDSYNDQDLTLVPLFIKMPNQKKGVVIRNKAFLINMRPFLKAFFEKGNAGIGKLLAAPSN